MWDPVILEVECIVCNKSLEKLNQNIRKPAVSAQNMGKVLNNRRSRTPNWSVDEKQYLLKLIKDRKEMIVTKNNNGPNYSEEKDVAWHEILRELSVRFGDKFSAHSIKKVKTQWQNMKRIAREEIALHGQNLQKCTKQTLDVCEILDLVKDGILDGEIENQTSLQSSNIVVKAEVLEEDLSQPSCSGVNLKIVEPSDPQSAQNRNQFQESLVSSDSDQLSEFENSNMNKSDRRQSNISDPKFHSTFLEDITNIHPYHRQFNEFFRYTSAEKKLKLETLKDERQVMRAMRETAELNKIIAEQKLKHVLWIKKQEMEMYSGEPGSGAGRGGGAGGSIREAGGSFGKAGAAKEDQYFYNKQREQLEQLSHMKDHLDKEISFHEQQIKLHEDAIRRQKQLKQNISTEDH